MAALTTAVTLFSVNHSLAISRSQNPADNSLAPFCRSPGEQCSPLSINETDVQPSPRTSSGQLVANASPRSISLNS